MSGYNENNMPYYFRPINNAYDDITFESCGYINGSWVEFEVGDKYVRFRRNIDKSIKVEGDFNGRIKMNSINRYDYNNVKQRDKLIGEEISELLLGYDSGTEAFEDNFRQIN